MYTNTMQEEVLQGSNVWFLIVYLNAHFFFPHITRIKISYTFETYMWQSLVEIEHYSVAYFDHIAVFEAL